MLHKDLTEVVIECCLDVIKELGSGFLESVYEKALLIALVQKGLRVRSQVPLQVRFRGEVVGDFFADIMNEPPSRKQRGILEYVVFLTSPQAAGNCTL